VTLGIEISKVSNDLQLVLEEISVEINLALKFSLHLRAVSVAVKAGLHELFQTLTCSCSSKVYIQISLWRICPRSRRGELSGSISPSHFHLAETIL